MAAAVDGWWRGQARTGGQIGQAEWTVFDKDSPDHDRLVENSNPDTLSIRRDYRPNM